MCTPTQGVWQPAGCVSCEPVCVCVSLVRAVIICPASTHSYRVGVQSEPGCSSPYYIHTYIHSDINTFFSLTLLVLSQLHGDDFLNDILGIGVASEQQPYLEPYHTPTHGNRDGDETCLPTTRATNVSGARGG